MATTNLLTLDRQLALGAKALDTWRRELAVDDRRDKDDPLYFARSKEVVSLWRLGPSA